MSRSSQQQHAGPRQPVCAPFLNPARVVTQGNTCSIQIDPYTPSDAHGRKPKMEMAANLIKMGVDLMLEDGRWSKHVQANQIAKLQIKVLKDGLDVRLRRIS